MGVSATARFVFNNSLLLLAGTLAAVVWANVDFPAYDAVAHSLHFWANDVGMVFFFALAAKEVFRGHTAGRVAVVSAPGVIPSRRGSGGMAVPAAIYSVFASTLGPQELLRGWAIPCATDIAFSAMVARLIFPAGHPGIPFLLLLAIADDALGLMILAVFYPSGNLSLGGTHHPHGRGGAARNVAATAND
jgi:NhaA family Na+:H+ antiporter